MKNKLKLSFFGVLFSLFWAFNVQAQTVQIGALVAGQIVKVFVKPGQKVKKGQALMTIDDRGYQAKLRGLQAVAEAKHLALMDAKINLDQALDLYDRTVSAKRSLDAVQLAYNLAKQADIKAQADVAALQAWRPYFHIKAPVSGQVGKIQAPEGTTVYKENTPLIEIIK